MTPSPSPRWPLERLTGGAAALHEEAVPDDSGRAVWHLDVVRPALVLGSTQSLDIVEPSAVEGAGIAVTTRRSGGGAVLLWPADALWLDVIVPRGDALWQDDISRSFDWLGDVWVQALEDLGVAAEAHRGPARRTEWSDLVCFAGLGAGEVTVGGAKAVGLSQRRTRHVARFQCVLHTGGAERVPGIVDLLRAPAAPDARAALRRHLAEHVAVVDLDPADVLTAFLHALPH